MCAWRRSLVIFSQVMQIAHEASKRRKMDYIMLTLTQKNVPGQDLAAELDHLFKSWDRLFKRTEVKKAVIGWFRALEVTHNLKNDTYHPHFHVLLAVPKSYLSGRDYIKQERWIQLWQESARLDYMPIVDIRTVKPKREGQTIEGAAAEVCKYPIKSGDYLVADPGQTDLAVSYLDSALKGRRLVAFGGLFKEVKRELQLDDIEDADLIHVEQEDKLCNCSVCGSGLRDHLYKWHVGLNNYVG